MSSIPELHKKYKPRYLTFDAQGIWFPFSMILHLSGIDVPNAISWLFKGLNLISHVCPKLSQMSKNFYNHSMTLKELQYRQHKQHILWQQNQCEDHDQIYGFDLWDRQRILRTDTGRVCDTDAQDTDALMLNLAQDQTGRWAPLPNAVAVRELAIRALCLCLFRNNNGVAFSSRVCCLDQPRS